MRLKLTIMLPFAGVFLSACGAVLGPTAQEMTLQTRNDELSTQIFDLRSTATVEVDRMMITVEHAQTEVNSVLDDRGGMRATSIAQGTEAGFFDVNIPQGANLPQGVTPEGLLPQDALADPAAAPPVTPPGAAPVNPNAAGGGGAPAATPPPATGARLTNPTLTTTVGTDDCATSSQVSFDEGTPEIYIVANAVEFPAGTTVTTTWTREGEVIDTYDYTYDFSIDNACIWSFIDQTDYAFTPGQWAVQLQVNGGAGISPVAFSVTGQAPAQAEGEGAMDEGAMMEETLEGQ